MVFCIVLTALLSSHHSVLCLKKIEQLISDLDNLHEVCSARKLRYALVLGKSHGFREADCVQ